jgi:nucleotide-binding universal stress UspA family protein
MTFKHIVVATDFSESAEHALELAAEMALKFEAALTLVHSWEAPSYSYGGGLYVPVDLITPIEEAARKRLAEALLTLKQRVPNADSSLRSGPAWQEILTAASELDADLIVVGTHGRRGLNRALLGSVAEKVVRMADVPVLTVHGAHRSEVTH